MAVVGVAVLLVAISLFFGASGTVIQTIATAGIAPYTNYTHEIPVTLVKSATFSLNWTGSASVQVFLYVAGVCGNGSGEYVCGEGGPVAHWWSATGTWTWSGAATEPWLIVVYNVNGTTVSFSGSMVETYPAKGTFTDGIGLLVLILASVVLLGIGSLAVFLGLFLRGGVYGRSQPPPVGQPDSAILPPPGDDGSDADWDDDRPPPPGQGENP